MKLGILILGLILVFALMGGLTIKKSTEEPWLPVPIKKEKNENSTRNF